MNKYKGYDNKVVTKPWGWEHTLIRLGKKLEVLFLQLDYNKRTSLHCHPQKKTAFVILNGRVKVQYGIYKKNFKIYGPLSRMVFRKGLFHSLKAVSKNGANVLEFETPVIKNDLIRFSDDYGRKNTGYESKNYTLDKNFNYLTLKIPKKNQKISKLKFKNINMELSYKKKFSTIIKNDKSTSAILNGKIVNERNKTVLNYGEVIKTNTLKILAKEFFIKKPLLILHISKSKPSKKSRH
jgi:mannose-6-phosphate isomerase-like protein (cupin superfamily)